MPTFGPTGIAASGDDYYHDSAGAWNNSATFLIWGEHPTTTRIYHATMWWDNIGISVGNTVSSASISFRTNGGGGSGTVYTKIAAVDENNAAAATGNPSCTTDDGIRTATQVDWDYAFNSNEDQPLTTVDFSPVVQELVDSGFIGPNEAMLTQIFDDGTTNVNQYVASFDHATYTEPTLTIVYSLPAQSIAVGAAAETEAAVAVSPVPGGVTIAVGGVTETEAAYTVEPRFTQSVAVGTASESEAAVAVAALAGAVTVTVGVASETEAVQPVTTIMIVAVAAASETEAAVNVVPVPGVVSVTVGTVTETEAAVAVTVTPGAVTVTVGVVTETEAAVSVTAVPGGVSIAVGLVSETEAAVAVSPVPGGVSITVGVAAEAEAAYTVILLIPYLPPFRVTIIDTGETTAWPTDSGATQVTLLAEPGTTVEVSDDTVTSVSLHPD